MNLKARYEIIIDIIYEHAKKHNFTDLGNGETVIYWPLISMSAENSLLMVKDKK